MAEQRYLLHLHCPRCDNVATEIGDSISRRYRCGDCLMERVEIVDMKVVAYEPAEEARQ